MQKVLNLKLIVKWYSEVIFNMQQRIIRDTQLSQSKSKSDSKVRVQSPIPKSNSKIQVKSPSLNSKV